MRSFRELFVQQSALAIFTAANEHGEREKGRRILQKVNREREREKERAGERGKKNRMEIRLGCYDEDNKSSHPAVSAHFAEPPPLPV